LSCHKDDKIINRGGTPVYMSPNTLESWQKHGGKVPKNPLLEDTFSFGLSILEMGNLLSLKNIRLNKEEELLQQ
jgi:hypothetical protein